LARCRDLSASEHCLAAWLRLSTLYPPRLEAQSQPNPGTPCRSGVRSSGQCPWAARRLNLPLAGHRQRLGTPSSVNRPGSIANPSRSVSFPRPIPSLALPEPTLGRRPQLTHSSVSHEFKCETWLRCRIVSLMRRICSCLRSAARDPHIRFPFRPERHSRTSMERSEPGSFVSAGFHRFFHPFKTPEPAPQLALAAGRRSTATPTPWSKLPSRAVSRPRADVSTVGPQNRRPVRC